MKLMRTTSPRTLNSVSNTTYRQGFVCLVIDREMKGTGVFRVVIDMRLGFW